ncbi:class I SAM-dependent methyltransferase [Luteimonas sp. RD2P54]|uniref:Class I SAM-dependent methyltransferase n=1 Tax=Luteimonas endophytica TaxID=3042023 RepID=A0ABT6J6C0_9GAMM|nr:class I SAM-dependent methyltransferase [Luteimonas endophytica]MDH5822371.1 class I SAM-dependent methyltransferase [Luteimonas endophytica]
MSSQAPFHDHFSAVAADYALARPDYPEALFDWIAAAARARGCAWEAGCGSGQASRSLAARFARVHASDPSAAQIAQARAPDNVHFAVEAAERCSLAGASADAVCVAQALHWFDRGAFFAECARVLRPGGVLVAWGYQDIEPDPVLRAAVDAFRGEIAACWPPERALVDGAYSGFDWPFPAIPVPAFAMAAEWPLARLLAYFASFSATRRFREQHGEDPVARHAPAIAAAWGEPERRRPLRWPLFVHARRKPM